jgi:hypothetical protein
MVVVVGAVSHLDTYRHSAALRPCLLTRKGGVLNDTPAHRHRLGMVSPFSWLGVLAATRCGEVQNVHARAEVGNHMNPIFRLAAALLGMASDQFSNHGCNDMPHELLDQFNEFERLALERMFNHYNNSTGEPIPFESIGDSEWMGFLADYLRRSVA